MDYLLKIKRKILLMNSGYHYLQFPCYDLERFKIQRTKKKEKRKNTPRFLTTYNLKSTTKNHSRAKHVQLSPLHFPLSTKKHLQLKLSP